MGPRRPLIVIALCGLLLGLPLALPSSRSPSRATGRAGFPASGRLAHLVEERAWQAQVRASAVGTPGDGSIETTATGTAVLVDPAPPVTDRASTAMPPSRGSSHTTRHRPAPAARSAAGHHRLAGVASWYETWNGTCAQKNLPLGTVVRVINLDNAKTITCTVADRGPYVGGRIIDLDKQGFADLAPGTQGLIHVRIEW